MTFSSDSLKALLYFIKYSSFYDLMKVRFSQSGLLGYLVRYVS